MCALGLREGRPQKTWQAEKSEAREALHSSRLTLGVHSKPVSALQRRPFSVPQAPQSSFGFWRCSSSRIPMAGGSSESPRKDLHTTTSSIGNTMQMRRKQLPERLAEFLQNIFNPRLVESDDLKPRTHGGM